MNQGSDSVAQVLVWERVRTEQAGLRSSKGWNAMSASTPPRVDAATAESQLRAFIEKFGAEDQRLIRAVRSACAGGCRRPTSWCGTTTTSS